MTLKDKKTFPCDFGEVNWSEYLKIYMFKGIAVSLLGDRSDKQTLKMNARKKKLIHYTFIGFCVLCAVFLFYMFLKKFLGNL